MILNFASLSLRRLRERGVRVEEGREGEEGVGERALWKPEPAEDLTLIAVGLSLVYGLGRVQG